MTPERWQKLKRLLDEALALESGECRRLAEGIPAL
jgi:hypothetical protein